jgi:hypothetical protein
VVGSLSGDEQDQVGDVVMRLTTIRSQATPADVELLRRFFAVHVLPEQPTARVREKHAKHVEDQLQWPDDTSPDEYLESLRDTVLNPRSGIYLAVAEVEGTRTIYFVGPVPYRSRGRYAGQRIVVLFNAERSFWITGFQAEAGDAYVNRQHGFWTHAPR